MFALGMHAAQTGKWPEHYVNVIESIAKTYIAGQAIYPPGEERPRFAFGPREIMVIADLEHMVDRIAKNHGARVFLESLVLGAKRSGDPKAMPTVFMTRVALERAGAQIEYVSAAEFGIAVGGRGN